MSAAVDRALERLSAGAIAEAEELCLQVLRCEDRDSQKLTRADAMQVLSLVAQARGEGGMALSRMREAVAIDPSNGQRRIDLAHVAMAESAHYEAAAHLEAVIAGCGELPDALLSLGRALLALGQPEFAADRLERAVSHAPDVAEAWFELGRAYTALGHHDGAVAALEAAQRHAHQDAQIALYLGEALHRAGRLSAAESLLSRVVADGSQGSRALMALGTVQLAVGNHEAARAQHRAATALEPCNPRAHRTLGDTELSTGHFENAWQCWVREEQLSPTPTATADRNPTAKHSADGAEKPAQFREPKRWDGRDVAQGHLVIAADPDGPETLWLLRFVPQIQHKFSSVTLETTPSFVPLLTRSLEGIAKVTSILHPAQSDYRTTLRCLPGLLNAGAPDAGSNRPLLSADPYLTARYRGRCGGPGSLRVGLLWQTTASEVGQRHPIHLSRYLPILGMPGLHCVSLQRGEAAAQTKRVPPAFHLQTVERFFENCAQTTDELAALVAAMDLVITVDDEVAHLAAGLGVRTWVLLENEPHPLWGTTQRQLYANARVFRAGARNDFGTVINEVRAALRSEVSHVETLRSA